MSHLRSAGTCLVLAVAIGVTCAASASAESPEFGRCVKKGAIGGAGYSDAGCLKAVTSSAKWEWLAGPGAKRKFSTKTSSSVPVIETVKDLKVTCKGGETGSGEYASATMIAAVVLKFTGCITGGLKCNSTGAPFGEVVTHPLEGVLGVIKKGETPAKSKLGLDVFASGHGNLMDMSCGGLKIEVRGSVIQPLSANRMVLEETVTFTARKGEQKVDGFEGEGTDAHTLELNTAGGPFEEAAWIRSLTKTNEEPIEARAF